MIMSKTLFFTVCHVPFQKGLKFFFDLIDAADGDIYSLWNVYTVAQDIQMLVYIMQSCAAFILLYERYSLTK